MDELFNLTAQLNTLSDIEFITFMKTFNKPTFISILFKYFHGQLQLCNHWQQIETKIIPNIKKINGAAAEIIQSREEKENSSEKQFKVDLLPPPLISLTASWLDLQSTLQFELCNKAIFIGTRSPVNLCSLSSKYFAKCVKFSTENNFVYNWYRFKSVQELSINIYDLQQKVDNRVVGIYKISNIPIWKWGNLRKLSLCGFQTGFEKSFENEFAQFFPTNITKLSVSADRLPQCTPNTAYDINIPFNTTNIKGLSLKGPASNALKTINENKFESFHNNSFDSLILNGKLINLKEICLLNPSSKNIKFLIDNNFKYLKRINVYHKHVGCGTNIINQNYYKQFLKTLFQLRSLNYIGIKSENEYIVLFIQVLIDSINNLKMSKEKIKIKLMSDKRKRWTNNMIDIITNLMKLITALDNSIANFMLICDITVNLAMNTQMKEFIDKLKIKYFVESKLNIQKNEKGVNCQFIVANKGCNINGYQVKWISSKMDICMQEKYFTESFRSWLGCAETTI